VHVGLNLIYLVPGETGGTETYARELIPELLRSAPGASFTAFINRETEHVRTSLGWLSDLPIVTVPIQARKRVEWVRGEQQLLPRLARASAVDLVHSLANTGPSWGPFKRVVTIHDIHFRLVPEAHTKIMRLGMGLLVPLAARRSQRIITDARSTVDELCEHLRVDRAKIDAVPLGIGNLARATPVAEPLLRERFALGERPIVLCVASKRPHKNLSRLISALSLIPAERRPVLVIPGYSTPHDDELQSDAAKLGVAADVHLLSWVTPEELEGLYAAALCLACPSLHEGFGLPVLEAMARGVPVACSGRGALAEVAGDAAVLFDPLAPSSIAAAIDQILTDQAESGRLRSAGLERANSFTWRATAEGTLAAYASALGATALH
jgi:glycosyltransferase involved in cell wall biosynthesis